MNTITKEKIQAILDNCHFQTGRIGQKTTVVCAILPNGFEITESSACVDPANYNQEVGESVCKERIANRIWQLEGYRLQCQLSEGGAQ